MRRKSGFSAALSSIGDFFDFIMTGLGADRPAPVRVESVRAIQSVPPRSPNDPIIQFNKALRMGAHQPLSTPTRPETVGPLAVAPAPTPVFRMVASAPVVAGPEFANLPDPDRARAIFSQRLAEYRPDLCAGVMMTPVGNRSRCQGWTLVA